MYKDFFGFHEVPFSIVPSSRYLFLSQRHREAMQHLQAGLGQGGGFAMLTGEVGTGKTTVAKAMLAALDDKTASGFILNPTFSSQDLLEAICDEFSLTYPEGASLKQLSQAIYRYLQSNEEQGVNTLLVIDEAQHLSADVLEQLRLLTNLETDDRKLLKVLLIGQPELQDKLRTTQLRQLAQRITGRYHLLPLTEGEARQYIEFRLSMAGGQSTLFSKSAVSVINHSSQGIPRLINLIADKSLQYAYHSGQKDVSKALAQKASEDILSFQAPGFVNGSHHSRATPNAINIRTIVGYMSLGTVGVSLALLLYFKGPELLALWPQSQKSPAGEAMASDSKVLTNTSHVAPSVTSLGAPQIRLGYSATLIDSVFLRSDKVAAIQELYKIWGYRATVLDGMCEGDGNSAFVCQKRLGTLQQVRDNNLPVMMPMYLDGRESYVVLYKLSDTHAQILNGSERLQVSIDTLESLWTGEYYFIWQRALTQTLRLNQTGEAVQILDEKLSKVLGSQPSGHNVFDQQLKRKVEVFQRWQHMDVDGIAGRNTLQTLELLTQVDAPSLALDASVKEVKHAM
ncbi:general secretion pathway protein GspA [Vibrio sp. 10N.286.49.C2]|uniref:ExeA family protein n=1 Tax=unclassified Vibrio TaxID=2614977 RepID=UPI000C83D14A|nr:MULTISPECIES: ExeA family protein [unclassified Vibrio]PMH27541.1 general secretion pathway protein GspA [Vibrio sp. 10N.286.49.C2]PMH52966.1 general secretion pathway protein GspA [Vibrio sp. 10N.286.49.B1]PMH83399.1 general secretion pathway protein GspA [Vibrio sp. 10N.286.48.B7]